MSAQLGDAIVLGYRPQGAQQLGSAVLLSDSPPPARKTISDFHALWTASVVRHVPTRAAWVKPTVAQVSPRAPWQPGSRQHSAARNGWGISKTGDIASANAWQEFTQRLNLVSSARWGLANTADIERAWLWGEFASRLALASDFLWGLAKAEDAEATGPWGQYGSHLSRSAGAAWNKPKASDHEQQHPWTKYSRTVQPAWSAVIVDGTVVVTVVVPIREAYIVINEASLRRVDGNIQLPTFGMSLNLDVDSWTWGFSASLPAETLANLEPASTGAPVEVEAMINGVAYRALVESISRSRSFGKSAISIQGRGKTALLDVPYSPVSNFTNSVGRTAQQLMADVLTVNAVPMPWLVDWYLTDWLVPAGVFAHQGSYIGALGRIAESVGGYLQPHPSAQAISVLPRYPSTPWSWGSVTPDFELPSSVTTTEGIGWVEKARYNRVFVSGVQQGVLGQVTRTGTAGDLLAPMITDALITHADAARQRGLSILANTGRQANVTLKLPVLAETGIITPGKFVRYVDGATTRTGIVRSVGVEVGMPDIFQTLGVETHVN
jgi:hypothetical protein